MPSKTGVKVQFSLAGDKAKQLQKTAIDQNVPSAGLAAKKIVEMVLDKPSLLSGAELDIIVVRKKLAALEEKAQDAEKKLDDLNMKFGELSEQWLSQAENTATILAHLTAIERRVGEILTEVRGPLGGK